VGAVAFVSLGMADNARCVAMVREALTQVQPNEPLVLSEAPYWAACAALLSGH
jgi:hypothetical protein